MLPSNSQEAIACFKSAKNLNAAIKNFLKRETGSNEDLVRFAKDFRTAANMGFSKQTEFFIDKNFKSKELFFLLVARFAHADVIGQICDSIVTTYGEEFNGTYNQSGDAVQVTDKGKFTSIVKESLKKIEDGLTQGNLTPTNFLKSTLLISIFDEQVLACSEFRSAVGL